MLEGKNLKPINPIKRKVKDPVRYPQIIIPIENKAIHILNSNLNLMIVNLTKEMVKIKNV